MKKLKKLFDNSTLHGKILRFSLVVVLFAAIFVGGYFILKATGLDSISKIRDIVKKGGAFSVIIFVLFQILQTTILQIPAMIVTIAGAWVFGPLPAFFMSYFAIMVGSIIMFIIGRKAGRPFLNWMIGKDTAEKWIDKMSAGKYLFFLMMVFPMFPDDILCCIAGLTQMSFWFFFWTNIIARGLGLICTVYFGTGAIIPFKGWGIAVWAVLIVVVAILFYLSLRFKDKIDALLDKMFRRKPKPATVSNTAGDKEIVKAETSTNSTVQDNVAADKQPVKKTKSSKKHKKDDDIK